MRLYLSYTSLILLLIQPLHAQVGGNSTYQFLNLPNSARVASMGGKLISLQDDDPGMIFQNPSLLNNQMSNHLSMNYADYFTDINYGFFSYAMALKNNNNLAFGIHYVNYGSFTETDATGTIIGHFGATEYALNVIYSHQFDSNLTIGVNLKPILSYLEKYQSYGIATDIGATWRSNDKLFSSALVFRNLGVQLLSYTGQQERLPFEILLGSSYRFKHAPFRITLTAQQLQRPKMHYNSLLNNEADTSLLNDPTTISVEQFEKDRPTSVGYVSGGLFSVFESIVENSADKIMRHVIVGFEFIPIENFFIRAGYNYQRRQELKIEKKLSTVGLSWGFGIRISKFQISYGSADYHIAGATNYISLSTNISDFYNKKEIK